MSKFSLKALPRPVLILGVGLVVAIAIGTLKPAPTPRPVEAPPIPQVEVLQALPQPQALPVTTQGTVAPRREIDLVAQVAGTVISVETNFIGGGFVLDGEVLVRIDDRDYRLALIRAEARVAEAAQLLATERGRARQAKREWRDLGNKEANDLFLRKPQLAATDAHLASAKADRDQAKLDLERTAISVPFAGRVRETYVDLGQYVTPGTHIAKVYDSSVAEIRLPLTDRQSALVDLPLGFRGDAEQPGPAVTIYGVMGGKRYQWQGRIARTDASVDTRSRMYYAVAEVENSTSGIEAADQKIEQPPLVVGLFVEAIISGRQLADVITLPKSSLFKRNQLYIVDGDNRVVQKSVDILYSNDEQVWIRADIQAGEQVVVNKQSYLMPGLIVESTLVNQPEQQAAQQADQKTEQQAAQQ